ncbi:NAD dependent epimerase/dehydratase, putative [Talaromyces stipitatus ATCC 10500]|uniref:NAD dependent epimerase/dehydratase, putative n=1 Tax=Talaromyces stipitatus (strain ATCC 10500 / CBS 375.48 / QM 6759 / NRRL 1006) TaxID=441959 RepID=B8LV09_TALSN|nr:NAD dependent epimerase/dehydratase, putative [Talaromyces stipitatus ATCC 10500]EED22630.1 NAD dependent epimerase/dehydratase, putative [Talaromyces stipitatus ATCC 10500]
MSQKIVTVVGSTGQQGKAVIAALAGNPQYRIRGVTRNPDSAAAKVLVSEGIEIVKADLNDLKSLTAAFQGSHIIFGVTDYWNSYPMYGPTKAKDVEREQASNLVKAASAIPTLEHYVWSTLPKGNKEYPVYHFEGKPEADDLVRAGPFLPPRTTLFMVCFYANNLQIASFRPYWIETANKYVQFTTYDPETIIPFIGAVKNITPFIKAIISNPEQTKNGAMVIGSIGQWTAKKWVGEWAAARGAQAQVVQISQKDYNALWPWPRWSEESALMMNYFNLDITPVETLEEWAKTYELPDPSSGSY